MNIETTIVTKEKEQFLVENIEDMIIRVSANQVAQILDKVDWVEENEIVILLATIKKSRIMITASKGKKYEKANEKLATTAIIKLLGQYTVENLISIFEEIKYYQIKEILESDAPIRAIEEYI